MTCAQIEGLLTRYLLGDLDPADLARVEEHLASCSKCRVEIEELRPTADLLRQSFASRAGELPRLDPARRARILASYGQRKPQVTVLMTVLKAAAVLAILLVFAGVSLVSVTGKTKKSAVAAAKARERAVTLATGDAEMEEGRKLQMAGEASDYFADGVTKVPAEASARPDSGAEPQRGAGQSTFGAPVLDVKPPSLSRSLGRFAAGLAGKAKPEPAPVEVTLLPTTTMNLDEAAAPAPSEAPPKPMASGPQTEGLDKKAAGRQPISEASISAASEFGVISAPTAAPAAAAPARPDGGSERRLSESPALAGSTGGPAAPAPGIRPPAMKGLAADHSYSYHATPAATGQRAELGSEFRSADTDGDGLRDRAGSALGDTREVNGWPLSAHATFVAGGVVASAQPRAGSEVKAPASPAVNDVLQSLDMPVEKSASDKASGKALLLAQVESSAKSDPMEGEARRGIAEQPAAKERVEERLREKAQGKDAQQPARHMDESMPMAQEKAVAAEPVVESVFPPQVYNPIVETKQNAFSTFGLDVDTASFTLARRYLLQGKRPPEGAIRVEEFVNAFEYAYRAPERDTFAVYADRTRSPFRPGLDVLRIGVRGKVVGRDRMRPSVLTFIIDTSGSMNTPDRLDLIRKSLVMLVDHLAPQDTVAVVAFGSEARLVLDQTPATQKDAIRAAINGLQTAGSTHLEAGMRLGYQMAARHFASGAINRVLLLSDGVANLGAATADEILAQIEHYRKQGIYCSVFGVGQGNYNDTMLETLADKGDGVYRFVDSPAEARRVFVDDLAATLCVIAKDVKIQVQFDPERVTRYRQIGYEKRHLEKEQFRDDAVDAGEVGAGQSATALYEVAVAGNPAEPLGTVRLRWKDAETGQVEERAIPIKADDRYATFESAPVRFRLAVGVAEFADLLRRNPNTAGTTVREVTAALRPVALELNLDQQVQDLVRMANAVRE